MFSFSPIFGEDDPNLTKSYFSKGLKLQPPTIVKGLWVVGNQINSLKTSAKILAKSCWDVNLGLGSLLEALRTLRLAERWQGAGHPGAKGIACFRPGVPPPKKNLKTHIGNWKIHENPTLLKMYFLLNMGIFLLAVLVF